MRSIELFAGAGGLALGMSRAGFEHAAIIEWNKDACDTIIQNRRRRVAHVGTWPIPQQLDARQFDFRDLTKEEMFVISGGPPCQPFSMGGNAQGNQDNRDMFPQAVRAVRELQPRAFIFENVKGLLREKFTTYLEYVLLQLSYPTITCGVKEKWTDHLSRLEQHKTAEREPVGLTYNVVFRLLNAANFGVPQKRERVFIVGFRSDLRIEWNFPEHTHSEEALLISKWVTGEYWDRHGIASRKRPLPPEKSRTRISQLALRHSQGKLLPALASWQTVRDAISDLPDPIGNAETGILNHEFNAGARAYPGHTGSPLDEPAKTLKAGDHGVPGGENMVALPDGSVRYFTVREAARLQTFPDRYAFHGSWTETMRQLGNAVPVKLAETVAKSVADVLAS